MNDESKRRIETLDAPGNVDVQRVLEAVGAVWQEQRSSRRSLYRLRMTYEARVRAIELAVPEFEDFDPALIVASDDAQLLAASLVEQRSTTEGLAKRVDAATTTLSEREKALNAERVASEAFACSSKAEKVWATLRRQSHRDVATIDADIEALANEEGLQVTAMQGELARSMEALRQLESEVTRQQSGRQRMNAWQKAVSRWARTHVIEFQDEEALLADISERARELSDAVADSGVLSRDEPYLLSVAAKIVEYADAYARSGQDVTDVLFATPEPGTLHSAEWLSVWRQLESVVGAELEDTQPLSSFDDHFAGRSAEDWQSVLNTEGSQDLGNVDAEQVQVWLEARQLRVSEFAHGFKSVPYRHRRDGADDAVIDRAWDSVTVGPDDPEYYLAPILMQARDQALHVVQRGPVNAVGKTGPEAVETKAPVITGGLGLTRLM